MSNIFQAMCSIQKEIKYIKKNKENVQQKFLFRGIDDVYNELHDLFSKHEVISIPEVLDDRTEERESRSGSSLIYRILKVKYTFYASDGSHVSTTVIGEGMDSGDKATNKAMSIAHKYALLQIFTVPTESMDDPDKESHELKPKSREGIPEIVKTFYTKVPHSRWQQFKSTVTKKYAGAGLKNITEILTHYEPEIMAQIETTQKFNHFIGVNGQ